MKFYFEILILTNNKNDYYLLDFEQTIIHEVYNNNNMTCKLIYIPTLCKNFKIGLVLSSYILTDLLERWEIIDKATNTSLSKFENLCI